MIESLTFAIIKQWLASFGSTIHVKPESTPIGTNFPVIVYRIISNQNWNSLQGKNATETRRVQIDIFTNTYTEGTLLRDRLNSNNPTGLIGGNFVIPVSYNNQTINMFVNSIMPVSDGYLLDKDSNKHRFHSDFFITYFRDEFVPE